MQGYETILVPIDIYSDYELVVEKAIAIAGNSHKIHLLYVAYPQTNVEPYGLFLERDFSEEVREQALRQLKDVAAKHDIPYSHINVEIGSPADEIHHMAEKVNADLIVSAPMPERSSFVTWVNGQWYYMVLRQTLL